jgi:hypothetical protein
VGNIINLGFYQDLSAGDIRLLQYNFKHMSSYNSSALLAQLKKQTQGFIYIAEKDFSNISHERLSQKPSPEAWSANECLQHLNSYGCYYLPAIEAALQKGSKTIGRADTQFVSGWLGAYFTRSMQPKADGTLASKMNSPKDHIPQQVLHSHEVINTFLLQQHRLLKLLEASAAVDMNEVRVPISIARFIKLKLGDVFMFIIAHNHRHILQAQRALQYR